MAFWEYKQNNSGGSFEGDYITIIIEANSAHEANARATHETDIYFDGCESGRDCSCCGDRWYPAHGKGDPVPSVYGEPLDKRTDAYDWGLKTLVLYADGRRSSPALAKTEA